MPTLKTCESCGAYLSVGGRTHCGSCAADEIERLRSSLARAEAERDEAVGKLDGARGAIASAATREASADNAVRDSEARRVDATSRAIAMEFDLASARNENDLARKAANEIRAMLGGIDDLVSGVALLSADRDHWRTVAKTAEAERDALDARVAKAEEVVSCARVLGTYDWESRLDDSRPSDDAKIDARELGIAVWHYDEFVRAHSAKPAPVSDDGTMLLPTFDRPGHAPGEE